MNEGPSETRKLDLGNAAALTVLIVGIVGAVLLLYSLIDIVILLFLGIVVAAALQPWHVRLCQLGVPRGPSVILIYLLFAGALVVVGVLVVPVLIEEMSKFTAGFPEQYAATRATLQASPTGLLRLIGERLPPFAALSQSFGGYGATLFAGVLGFTEGQQEGVTLILRQLQRRYGELALPVQEGIRRLSLPHLEALGEALWEFGGPADLEQWLATHGQR